MHPLRIGIQLVARGRGDPATTPFPSHRTLLEDGMEVERLGYDSVWLPDHFFFHQAGGIATYPDVWTLLGALAVKTERITLGTNVIAATFRHPALLAKMAAGLQDLCGGRFVLGIGAGNQAPEHEAFGFDFEHRVGRFKEYVPILHRLLNGETVTHSGRYFTLTDASLRTAVPRVPIWIASGGPQMFELTARYASGWNLVGGRDASSIKQKSDEFASACRAAGRDIDEFEICKLSFVAIAQDAPGAERMLQELATKSNVPPEQLAARTLVGTPQTIAAHLKMLTQLGINQHMVSIAQSEQWPNYRDALAFFRAEVVARLER